MGDSNNEADTQTQSIESSLSSQNDTIVPVTPWGRLISCKIGLPCIDLVNSVTTFGRDETCNIMVSRKLFRNINNISKVHFRIERSETDALVYLVDLSKNGTSINGSGRIGKNQRRILKNNDLISVGFPKEFKVYIFKYYKDMDTFLPECLQSKYESLKVIGRGACGEVHLVVDRITCEWWAVKKIIKGRSDSSQINKINHPTKIQREINILKSLSHPNIIKMREIKETEKDVYIVLEYMPGGELTDRILSVDKMSEATAKFFFYQMILAVKYLHSIDIVHRDLKPENILLNDTPNGVLVKITDFGLSKDIEQSLMETACGTMCYVAPEVLSEHFRGHYGEYGKKVDVWSLGVILYYMLCQELPFQSKARNILSRQIVTGAYQMKSANWNNVSSQAKDLVRKMLVVVPSRRLSIDDILLHPWLKNDPIVAHKVDAVLQNYSDCSLDETRTKKFKFCHTILINESEESRDSVSVIDD